MRRQKYRRYDHNGLPGTAATDHRVIRSEVWNCFDLDGLNAICRACNERLKVGPTRQTSSLWRHLKRHTREVQSQLLHPNKHPPRTFQPGGLMAPECRTIFDQHREMLTMSSSSATISPADSCPSVGVTVDCKPVNTLDLEQLLGIPQRDECQQQRSGMAEEGGGNGAAEDRKTSGGEDGTEEGSELDRTIIQLLLENGLSFHTLLVQSPTLGRLLSLTSQGPMSIPSPGHLLHGLVPKMFIRTLDERKAQFEEDFFVLVLRRTKVDQQTPGEGAAKTIWTLRVSVVKLGDSFGLCSRCLGVFAFQGGSNGILGVLQRCFEIGRVQLRLWQVSAVVHDGSADFVELCRQLDLPGIPSARSLLRNVYLELDKLEFPENCVRRVKNRFELALGNALDCIHFSAFSIAVPILISIVDLFFLQTIRAKESELVGSPMTIEDRLMGKFHTLWTFQRERLLADPVARMSIFLNPNSCQRADFPFAIDQWDQVAAKVVQEICEACAPNEEEIEDQKGEEKALQQRREIEREVSSYMDAAQAEQSKGVLSDSRDEVVEPKYEQSLSELLFWWRSNLERFPRVGHLARQFCAIPLCVESGEWRRKMDSDSTDAKNAEYAGELLHKDLTEQREEDKLDIISQLLTVRVTELERIGCPSTD